MFSGGEGGAWTIVGLTSLKCFLPCNLKFESVLGLSLDQTRRAGFSFSLCGLWRPGSWVGILPVHRREACVSGASPMELWPTVAFQGTTREERQGLASDSCLVTCWLHSFRWTISCLCLLASSSKSNDNTCLWELLWAGSEKMAVQGGGRRGVQLALVPFSGLPLCVSLSEVSLEHEVQCRASWTMFLNWTSVKCGNFMSSEKKCWT